MEQAANVAVCAAVRERAEDILEWVSYHKYIGISKFYLMITDDPKVGHVKEVLRAFWEQGTVEIYHLPYVNPRTVQQLQVRLYSICLESVRCVTSLTVMSFTKPKNEWKTGNVLCCREDHDFLGFWDVDEFVMPNVNQITGQEANISIFLSNFTHFGGLALNWRIVGPSGHDLKPSGGVLKNYNRCTPWSYKENEEIKSIVNTKYALKPTSDPHTFVFKDGYFAVDNNGRQVQGGVHSLGVESPPRFALYHFVTKSKSEYEEKMKRGSAMGNRKTISYFNEIESAANVTCEEGILMSNNI